MPIYNDFLSRLNRSHELAQETAKGATLNRDAWKMIVRDLSAMKRLIDEAGLFTGESLDRAEVGLTNAGTLESLNIQQAENAGSAKLIGDNTDLFGRRDVGTAKNWLETVDPDVFAEAWKRLDVERQGELVKLL